MTKLKLSTTESPQSADDFTTNMQLDSPVSVVSEQTEYSWQDAVTELRERIAKVELRLFCTCDAIAKSRSEHQQWCTLYIAPPRTRDCYKCGASGFISIGNDQAVLCDLCYGQGRVLERWIDGKLVW